MTASARPHWWRSPASIAPRLRRWCAGCWKKVLLSRERTEEDQRANAVAISPSGRKALRGARNAADRAERALLEALPQPERQKFVKALTQIAQAAEQLNGDGVKARPPQCAPAEDRRLKPRP